jgi:hypothetical protein
MESARTNFSYMCGDERKIYKPNEHTEISKTKIKNQEGYVERSRTGNYWVICRIRSMQVRALASMSNARIQYMWPCESNEAVFLQTSIQLYSWSDTYLLPWSINAIRPSVKSYHILARDDETNAFSLFFLQEQRETIDVLLPRIRGQLETNTTH